MFECNSAFFFNCVKLGQVFAIGKKKARGRVVLHCCSYLSHLSAPMYMQADTQFLKVTVAKTLATLKGRLL